MPQQRHNVLEHSDPRLIGDLLEQATEVGITHFPHACREKRALGLLHSNLQPIWWPRQSLCQHLLAATLRGPLLACSSLPWACSTTQTASAPLLAA